jgi:hypothetical protein
MVLRNFIICDKIMEGDDVGRQAGSMHGINEKCIQNV